MLIRFVYFLGGLLWLFGFLGVTYHTITAWVHAPVSLVIKSTHPIDNQSVIQDIFLEMQPKGHLWVDLDNVVHAMKPYLPDDAAVWLRRRWVNYFELYVDFQLPWALWNGRTVISESGKVLGQSGDMQALYQLSGSDKTQTLRQAKTYIDLLVRHSKHLRFEGLRNENGNTVLLLTHDVRVYLPPYFATEHLKKFLQYVDVKNTSINNRSVYLSDQRGFVISKENTKK